MGTVIFALITLLYFIIPKFPSRGDSFPKLQWPNISHIDSANVSIFLLITSFILLTIASVLRAGEKYKESELIGYEPEYFKRIEVESYSYAELNYAIQKIEDMIKNDPKNAWQWEAKLKSVVYRRNKLPQQSGVSEELSPEQINKLENESHLIKLNKYNLKAKSDLPTVYSIKDKMALYRKHKQEKV